MSTGYPHGETIAIDAGYADTLRACVLRAGGPLVFAAFAQPKRVKNLGWLLRHAAVVDYVCIRGSFMAVSLGRGALKYGCDWADQSVMREWLKRPSFQGVPVHDLTGAP